MRKIVYVTAAVVAGAALLACGPKPQPPVTGADLVATAVAARYLVKVDGVTETDGRYKWAVSAVNGSEYAWRGTLSLKLVDTSNRILESHDFEIEEMAPPGHKTTGLTFTSDLAPVERGGEVARLKAEVNVAEYEEPAAGEE
ncbi:MAG: hypothetical protein JSU81_07615 [Candidatus Coatesbacteria bacterium]|nr:MAG: hypothetical protein JSU81_07615 [Candidatus Coatesbacteria bacterium]